MWSFYMSSIDVWGSRLQRWYRDSTATNRMESQDSHQKESGIVSNKIVPNAINDYDMTNSTFLICN